LKSRDVSLETNAAVVVGSKTVITPPHVPQEAR